MDRVLELPFDDSLNQARKLEREYDWLKAVAHYRKAVHLIPTNNPTAKAEALEGYAQAIYRGARQAEGFQEFMESMRKARASFEEARGLYQKLTPTRGSPRSLRCAAMIAFIGFWVALGPSQKKRLIDESWMLTQRALNQFGKAEEPLEYAVTFDELSRVAILKAEYEWEFSNRLNLIKGFEKFGDKACELASTLKDPYQSAKTTAGTAVCLRYFADFLTGLEEGQTISRKALDYWLKAIKPNEGVALVELAYLGSHPEAGDRGERGMEGWLKVLECARKSRDTLLQGWVLDKLALTTLDKGWVTEAPDDRTALLDRGLKYAERANQYYSKINFMSPRRGELWTGAPHASHYFSLSLFAPNSREAYDQLEKSLELAPAFLRKALESGYPGIVLEHTEQCYQARLHLANIESKPDKKKRLLREALPYVNEGIRILDKIMPFNDDDRGMHLQYLAGLKARMADLVEDKKTKRRMFEQAVSDGKISWELRLRALAFSDKHGIETPPDQLLALGASRALHGELFKSLYALTKNADDLQSAANAFKEAANLLRRADLPSWMAEYFWRAALIWDMLDQRPKASENFRLAAGCYQQAAGKISQLSELFSDYSSYMRAWSEIEKARYQHARGEYGLAKTSYKRAARLHHSTGRWSYLTPNYSAWGWLEDAEELSRHERPQEAILAFRRATSKFQQCAKTLKLAIPKIENGSVFGGEEWKTAANLHRAAELRNAYCNARIRMEEAKLFDRKGEYEASSCSYDEAMEILKNLLVSLEPGEAREIKLVLTLTDAWKSVERAEEEVSPDHYLHASRLFAKARDLGSNERIKLLISGHVHLCQALQASAGFVDTGKTALHSSATHHLESANRYYLAADFRIAAAFSRATQLLFDAYLHMNRAKTERDHEKKAALYLMAEKLLRESAARYAESGQAARKERVERLLESVMEDRELAVSLSAFIHPLTILSTTAAFSTPTSTHEAAVGLNGFEHSTIQARVSCRPRIVKQGERIEINLDVANAGKTSAQLLRLDEVVPAQFELLENSTGMKITDRSVDLKGMVVGPLKSRSVTLILIGRNQGVYSFTPRIVYADDRGGNRTYEPEPIEIVVSPILKFLASCFEEDYAHSRIPSGEAGWRTLMDIVESEGLSRNQVYGDTRRGRTFGKPLETLVEQGLVEIRVFPGERGRGGRVLKVRVNYPKDRARKLLKVSAMPT